MRFEAIPEPQLEPGLYYLGDPCYIIPDEDWIDLLHEVDYFKETHVYRIDGWVAAAMPTEYGDGEYTAFKTFSNGGHKAIGNLGVDAGLIGVIPWKIVEQANQEGEAALLGLAVDFHAPFSVRRNSEGTLWFGPYKVPTGD